MNVRGLTPILNVSDIAESFDWFERLGWKKLWDWGTPPTFGGVGLGPCEIFLCEGAQGGRGRSSLSVTSGVEGAEEADQGVWMSLWVDDVDAVHDRYLAEGVEVTFPPTDQPWNVREMHLRHPDGHVFRISRGLDFDAGVESVIPVERVDLTVRLEKRLAALLRDLAEHKGLDVGNCLEETLLHTFEQTSGGVASPHTGSTHAYIDGLRLEHGIDYDTHASARFVERPE